MTRGSSAERSRPMLKASFRSAGLGRVEALGLHRDIAAIVRRAADRLLVLSASGSAKNCADSLKTSSIRVRDRCRGRSMIEEADAARRSADLGRERIEGAGSPARAGARSITGSLSLISVVSVLPKGSASSAPAGKQRSVLALGDEARGVAQHVGLVAESGERLLRLRRRGRRGACVAASTPQRPISVALPFSESLPVALPSVAASDSTSSRSSAIWNAWPSMWP